MLVVLYKLDTKGKIREWSVQVKNIGNTASIIVNTGVKDGKMIENINIIKSGKNKGKINETTPYQQAINEANGKINKKKDEGYVENITLVSKKMSRPLPMLAHDFKKRGKDIKFPCYAQPKLDGTRTVYDYKKLKFYSRNNKDYLHFQDILQELVGINLYLDGEMYTDEIPFEEFVGLSKKKKLSQDDIDHLKLLKFHVYDVIVPGLSYKERLELIRGIFKENKFKKIVLVETKKCDDKDMAYKFLEDYTSKGFEGLMLRNYDGLYEVNGRSKNLQKYKFFQDDEYEIIGAKTGIGREAGAVIWLCKTKQGKTFDVRPKGTIESRRKIYKDFKKYVGKMLTVKFFRFTKEGIPLFPTTLHADLAAIRD